MIKEPQKHSIYVTYQRTFLKQLLKRTFEPTKENLNIKGKLCLIDKVTNVVQLLVQSDGETYCYCENLPAHMIQIAAIYVYIYYNNVFLVYLKFILL